MNATPISLPEWLVVGLGLLGQALFSARLLVQWIASERQAKSVVPEVFWVLSLAGGITLFLYAAYRRDPVFMVGQAFGIVVYVRNLWLIRRDAGASSSPGGLAPADEQP